MPDPKPFFVLVVDDYPDSAEATAQLVGLYGYDAVAAHAYREALDVVAGGFAPDLAILDVRLPDGDGCDLAEELCRALGRRPVLVAVTGLQGRRRGAAPPGSTTYLSSRPTRRRCAPSSNGTRAANYPTRPSNGSASRAISASIFAASRRGRAVPSSIRFNPRRPSSVASTVVNG